MFGGLQGLEAALENDECLEADDPKLLFDYYMNALPNQGSRTIRTEEALLVALATLRSKLNPQVAAKTFTDVDQIAMSNETNLFPNKTKPVKRKSDLSRFD